MLLNNELVKNDIKEEIKKFLETNENELTTVENRWDTARAVLRGTFKRYRPTLKREKHFKYTTQPCIYKNWRNNNKESPERTKMAA